MPANHRTAPPHHQCNVRTAQVWAFSKTFCSEHFVSWCRTTSLSRFCVLALMSAHVFANMRKWFSTCLRYRPSGSYHLSSTGTQHLYAPHRRIATAFQHRANAVLYACDKIGLKHGGIAPFRRCDILTFWNAAASTLRGRVPETTFLHL